MWDWGGRRIGAASWKGYVCIRWESCSGERGYVESGEELRWWIRKVHLYCFYYERVM